MGTEATTKAFLIACRANIKREGMEEMLHWLEETDFFSAPASTRFHGAFEGGLVMHSLNVFNRLTDLVKFYGEQDIRFKIDPESIAISALFHDICKVQTYKVSMRNVKNDQTGKWEKKPYYVKMEDFPFGGHGSKSVYLVQSFMKLKPDEAAAINCHMSFWDKSDYGNPGAVFEQNPLAWMLHVADEAATYIDGC